MYHAEIFLLPQIPHKPTSPAFKKVLSLQAKLLHRHELGTNSGFRTFEQTKHVRANGSFSTEHSGHECSGTIRSVVFSGCSVDGKILFEWVDCFVGSGIGSMSGTGFDFDGLSWVMLLSSPSLSLAVEISSSFISSFSTCLDRPGSFLLTWS